MSLSGEAGRTDNLEFKWGKKRGVGGKNNEVQFYASFKYDGVDYSVYDCVYMHKEAETEPYIGKLIKIWETADKAKKVKIHWFFHPSEILNWLGDDEVHGNEIFLASGEGAGLANVNPLEAIAGKCNVVCISKDSRNPQPSEQELRMADYVFYRTFDVGNCTISDKIDEKVAGLAVKFLFNTKEGENISDVSKLDSDKKEEPVELKTARADGNLCDLGQSGSDNINDSLVGRKSLPEAKSAHAALDSGEATTSGRQGSRAGDKATSYGMESDKNEKKKAKLPANRAEVEDAVKSQDSGALENKPSKKSTAVGSVKSSENRNISRKTSVDRNDAKGVKSARDTGTLDDRPSKKARVDSSVKLSENRKDTGAQKLSINSDRNKGKELAATLTSGAGLIGEVSSHCFDKDLLKQKTGEKTNLSNGKMLKVSASVEDRKTEGETFVVTRRSNDVKGNWFREIPWEERMSSAQEQGTLVQLSNVDPECTSKEVEDIIWHAFKENCTAKMVPRNAISSPHSVQALIILKTRGAAERIIMELDDKCLMLPNKCPLIGSTVPPHSVQKKSTFVGHLSVDISKHQTRQEWKEALSTSHYSQPNNIEYEMAMEWCLLQTRSKLWWKQFYQQQGEELRKLKANLKLK